MFEMDHLLLLFMSSEADGRQREGNPGKKQHNGPQ